MRDFCVRGHNSAIAGGGICFGDYSQLRFSQGCFLVEPLHELIGGLVLFAWITTGSGTLQQSPVYLANIAGCRFSLDCLCCCLPLFLGCTLGKETAQEGE